MEARYGGTDVMERSCAVARGIDINTKWAILNYRTADCPCIAAPSYVGVECPAALFHFSAQPKPKPPVGGWLFIYCEYIIGYKWRTWLVRPVPPAYYVAALLLLSLPYLTCTSIIDIFVSRALHRVLYEHSSLCGTGTAVLIQSTVV
jgi:hypothetical protein